MIYLDCVIMNYLKCKRKANCEKHKIIEITTRVIDTFLN